MLKKQNFCLFYYALVNKDLSFISVSCILSTFWGVKTMQNKDQLYRSKLRHKRFVYYVVFLFSLN